ncbi:MAG: glutamate--tRNA ligase [Candidatus Anstonellales archaeon]
MHAKEKLIEEARNIAMINAAKYGKTSIDFVLPKLFGKFPDMKDEIKAIVNEIKAIVEEVNKMPIEEIALNAEKIKEHSKIQKQEKKKYIIRDVGRDIITRFSPEPSGFLHIGHAKAAFLSYAIAEENKGRMILRFDDTNPEKSKEEYVNAIMDDLNWLGIKPESISFSSDFIQGMYKKIEELIINAKAFICECEDEEIANYRAKKMECPHRNREVNENLEIFNDMIKGKVKKGKAVLLYKGDIKSNNTALRDPAIARIMDAYHFRHGNKYKLWPTYHFASVYMDAMQGITHAIRSKEYELFGELYYALLKDMFPEKDIELIHISRLFVPGYPISKREIRALIEQGKIASWDDPRLLTLKALKRRGVMPEAIKEFSLSFGLGKQENPADISILMQKNRAILDKIANRYFFVEQPIEVSIESDFDIPESILIRKNPNKQEHRIVMVNNIIYVQRADWDSFVDGEIIRLKEFSNAVVDKKNKKLLLEKGEPKGLPKIQWIAKDFFVNATIIEPKQPLHDNGEFNDNSLIMHKGIAEKNINELDEGSIIQFERVCFCRLDKKGQEPLFIWSS